MELQELLQRALKMEEDGRNFYLEGAGRVKNQLAKEVLNHLADDELDHIERIKEGYERITKNEPFATKEIQGLKRSSREYFENIFTEAQKKSQELIKHEAEELDILKTALDLESKSHQFYSEQIGEQSDEQVKQFLDFLASEEYRHYNLIFNTIQYITNPTDWYYQEEKPIFEGG
ncbi:ferritin family protein [Thermatribacter velox]|uniref:Ferritin family protein n=1 Tax=Thermatribacter velox TaxID=3039681 RepID=A0ABZ2YDN4_9BACT